MKSNRTIFLISVVLLGFLVATYNACSDPKTTEIQIGSSQETILGNPIEISSYPVTISTKAYQSSQGFSDLIACIKFLELTKPDSSLLRIPLEWGDIEIAAGGTVLGLVAITIGDYENAKLKLSSSCISGQSLSFTNSSGLFNSVDNIDLNFVGSMTIGPNPGQMEFDLQPLINNLAPVTLGTNIKSVAEGVTGSYDFF